MSDEVLSERAQGVLTLTLNRPAKKNALTPAMYVALGEAIDAAGQDPDVRAILIQANGDAFTGGNDIATFASDPKAVEAANVLLRALARATTPLVAAVHGRAVGVGVTLLLHCDLVYVAEDALLSTPFANLALVPEAASSILLPARIGHPRAFSMFVLGETVDGRTAAAWGLANAAVPAAEVRARALEAVRAIAARPPGAVAITKALMRDPAALSRQMDIEGGHFLAQLQTPEAREAFAAFVEKRPADFSRT